MKNKRILAALLSATMIFSSVPYTVLANSPNASSESVFTTSDSSNSDETKNDGETTDTTFSDSSNDDASDRHDSTSDDAHDTTGDQSVVSSSSTSSTAEKPAIEGVTFKIKGADKKDKNNVIPLVYDESVCDPSDLIQPIGVQDTDTVSYTVNVNGKTWEEPKTKTPLAVGKYKISVTVSRPEYQDLTETATFSIKAADLDKETYEKKFTAANVLYDGAAHELLTASDLASDDVVSYVMDGKESDKIPSATEPGQYSITVKIKKGSTEKEQANYNTLSLSFVATIERDVAADVQYASAAKTENNVLYYNQNAELTFSVTTKDFDSKLANVMVSKDDGAYQNVSDLAWEKKADSDLVYTAKYTISESGSYRFRIFYQDVSGNAQTRYETSDDTLKKIVIDTDKPVIKLSYDKGDISDFDSTTSFPYRRKATITVRDDNLTATPASINVQAVNVKDGSDVSDAYEIGAWQKSSDGTDTCEVSFQQDAKYSIQISSEDQSGNNSEISDKFIIDTTNPKISISYDNNDSQNDSYFNNTRTMTLTVSDDEADYDTLSLPVTVNGNSVSMTLSGLQNGDYEQYGIVLKQFEKEQGELVLSCGKTDNAVFDYTVSASVKDKAGNSSEAVTYADGTTGKEHFIIDKVKPVMSVSAQSAKTYLPLSVDEKNPSYAANPVTLSLGATDTYFDVSSVSVELTQTDANGETVHAYELPDLTSGWTRDGNTWNFTLPDFKNDANYSLKFSCKDKAGNVSDTYGPYYFTVDQTAPTGQLSISDGTDTSVFQKLSDTLRYWIFKQSPVTVNGTAEDATSGLSTAEYMVYAPDQTGDSFSGLTYEQLVSIDADTWKPWTGSVAINASEKGFLYLKLTDKAGNVSFINTSDGIIVDDGTSMDVQITPQTDVPKNGVYKADVPFKINVTAPENDKTFTGIRHIDWRVETNGKTTQSGNYDSETDTDTNRAEILRQFSHSETVKSSLNNSNDVKVFVSVEDWAGNRKETSISLAIDTTNPKISASYDNNNVKNNLYFNADRNMTLTVRERNFSEDDLVLPLRIGKNSVHVSMQDIRDGKYGLVMVSDRVDSEKNTSSDAYTDDRTNTYVIGFGHAADCDEDFEVSAQASDLAGNKTDQIQFAGGNKATDAFTIDKIKPVIRITGKTESSSTLDLSTDKDAPAYSKELVTLSVSVTERNFKASDASESLTQTDINGKTVSAYTLPSLATGWTQKDDVHTFVLPDFAKDANYGYDFAYTDLAGNTAEAYPTQYFTVDKTAPEGYLSITGQEGSTSVFRKLTQLLRYWFFGKDTITVTGEGEDETSGLSSVQYYIYSPEQNDSGNISGPTYDDLMKIDPSLWKTWTGSASIAQNQKGFLYLRMEDKAGNISFVNTSDGIIVNSQAKANVSISVTPETSGSSDQIYADDVPLQISVEAPSDDSLFAGIRHVEWKVTSAGKITQSGNYDSETDTDANRSQRLRSLNKKIIVYAAKNNSNNVVVQVTVEDWAGNTSTISTPLRIDVTKPVITASYDKNYVKNDKYFNTERNMTLTVRERNFSENDLVLPLQIGTNIVRVSMQDIRDGKYGLVMVSDRVDSEENTSSNAYTDDRTNTYVIGFGHTEDCDEDFKVAAQVSDLAGNETDQIQFADGSKAADAFTIDKIKPVIRVTAKTESSPSWDLSTDKDAPAYSRESVTLSVSVTERNFGADGASESLTQKDADGQTVSAYTLPNLATGWTQTDNIHTFVLPDFTKDANYGYNFTYTDLAGNAAAAYPTQYFTVDKTAPEGSLSVSDKGESSLFDKLSGLIRYWFFDKDSVKITGSSKDQTSGLASVTSYLFNPESDKSGEFSGPTYDELLQMDNANWKPWTGSTTINKNEKGFLYLRMEDKAGNISFVNTSDGVIVSSQANLSITVTPKAKPSSNGIYANDVPFQISVKAPDDDPLFTGIRYVKWQILKDGEVTQSGNYNDVTDGDTHRANRLRSLEKNEVVSAEKNNSNDVLIQVTAEDWAGNTSSVSLPLSIDITKPTVSASYDNNDVRHEKYFNRQRDMTITVQDRNFNENDFTLPMQIGKDQVTVTMQDIRDGKYGLTLVSDRVDSEKNISSKAYTDDRTNTYVIGFGHADNSDEDFQVSVNIIDGAGNTCGDIAFAKGTNAPTTFTIDKVAPLLTIAASSNGTAISLSKDKKAPLYTRSDVTLTAAVDERNFDTNGTDFDLTQTDYNRKELSVYEKPDLTKGWKTDGSTHTLELPVFSNDANYGVSFAYTDLAGNQAVTYPAHYFTIDKTVPTGTLTIRDDDEASLFDKLTEKIRFWIFRNHSISVEGKSEDVTSGIRSVSYLIYDPGAEARDEFQGLSYTQLTAQTDWKPWNGSVSIEPDQAGFVYLRMEDMAGNVAFINTSDGMIADTQAADRIQIQLLSDPTADGVYNSDVPFEISVADPVSGDTYSGLRHVSWEITNGETVTQKGNYDSETDGDSNRSKRIDSLTKRETVSAEKNNGNDIQIHVYTEDWAGNKAEKSLSLIIDTTKPEISMSYDNQDVHNGKYYNKNRNMTLTIKERNFKESGISLPIVVDGQSYNVSMQDIRNGRLGLVMVSDAHDSQSGFSKEEWTDDRTVTYIIGFGHASNTDDDYTVSANAEDMAANQNSESGESFTIDKIAPVIAVSLTSGSGTLDPSTDAYNPAYARSAVQAEVTIAERNFDGKDASTQITQKNAEGKDLSAYTVPDVRKGWTSQNGTNHYTFPTFSNDANYSLSLGYTDLAGNQAVPYTPHYFTVDQTAPVGALTTGVKGESSIFNTLANLIRFWFYNNTAIPVSGTYSDETAGIASASYLIYEPGENSKGTFNGLTTSELNNLGGWQSWNGSTIVAPNKGAFVYVKLVDRAGNVNYLNTSNGIVADNVAPSKINIELLATPSSQNIFNTDVPFKVTAADPSSGGTYAGLKHVTWQVLNNGAVTQSGNFDSSLGDRTARVQSITGTAKVEASRNNSNRVTIRVRTEDWAGNTAETTKDLAIDITKPKIEIIYDHNNPVNGKYYNQTRVATVRVTERNFDPSKVNLKITSTGQKPSISGWTISPQAGSSDNAVNTCTITFSADADYTLNASVTDKAGNVSDYNRTDTFTIDQTRPQISVSYSGGNVRNGKYFDQKRTATITVTEHNFDPSQFRISIQAALDGKDIDKPVLSSWTSRGDTHTASVTFLHDGDYSFTAETGDLAGNRSDKYTQSSFTIDTKAPELSFFDIKDHSANKDTVAPGIRSTDLNFDFSAVTLTLKGAKHKEKTVQGTVSDTANGVSIKLSDFAHNKQTDDIYTLTARIQDKAGNVIEKSIVFSVNRYGSNFTFGKKTAERLDKYYLSKSGKLVIYETNVDQIVDSEIVVLKDGTSTTLKKGSDYTVEDESEMNGWHKYKYTISDHCFSKEGLYEIQIRTSDKAGNIQDNKIKNSPIRFVIDRTAPTAVVTGVVNNGRYKELSRKIYVQVTDNYAYGSVSLYLGDRKVKSFDAETVANKDGKLSYTLKSANGWQRIRVEYNDLAGNHGNPVSMRVLVSASTWQQILYSEWFMPTIVAIFGGIVFLILLILLRKRKKKTSTEKA